MDLGAVLSGGALPMLGFTVLSVVLGFSLVKYLTRQQSSDSSDQPSGTLVREKS